MDSAAIPGAGAIGASQVNPSETATRGRRTDGATAVHSVPPAASVDALPSSPPPEVLEQLAQAHRVYEQLSAQGHSLHFDHDEAGRVRVQLRDGEGRPLRELSLAETLELATGGSPE